MNNDEKIPYYLQSLHSEMQKLVEAATLQLTQNKLSGGFKLSYQIESLLESVYKDGVVEWIESNREMFKGKIKAHLETNIDAIAGTVVQMIIDGRLS